MSASICNDPTCAVHQVEEKLAKQEKIGWRLTVVSILSILLAGFLLIGGLLTHSLPIVSESGHQALDALLLVYIWRLVAMTTKKSDVKYTFGYKKWDWIVNSKANLILIVFELIATYNAVTELTHVEHADPRMVFLLEGINIIVNVGIAWIISSDKSSGGKFIFQHNVYDALKSVGVVFAYVAIQVGYTTFSGLNIEALTAVVVGCFVTIAAYKQMSQTDRLLAGETPASIDLYGLTHAIRNIEKVQRVTDVGIVDGNILTLDLGTHNISIGEQLEIEKSVGEVVQRFSIAKAIVRFYNVQKLENQHRPAFIDIQRADFTKEAYDPKEINGSGIYIANQHGSHYHLVKAPSNVLVQEYTDITTLDGDGFYEIEAHGDHCHFKKIKSVSLDATQQTAHA